MDDVNAEPPPWESIRTVTLTVFGDIDQGPTKVWMIYNRAEEDVKPLFELGFGKRPREELYDLRKDPDYMQNVAYESEYEQIRADLNSRLMSALKEHDDPRVTESPPRFEQSPYAGPVPEEWDAENRRLLAARDPRLFRKRVRKSIAVNRLIRSQRCAQFRSPHPNLPPSRGKGLICGNYAQPLYSD